LLCATLCVTHVSESGALTEPMFNTTKLPTGRQLVIGRMKVHMVLKLKLSSTVKNRVGCLYLSKPQRKVLLEYTGSYYLGPS
jgi:hypothetical protein